MIVSFPFALARPQTRETERVSSLAKNVNNAVIFFLAPPSAHLLHHVSSRPVRFASLFSVSPRALDTAQRDRPAQCAYQPSAL